MIRRTIGMEICTVKGDFCQVHFIIFLWSVTLYSVLSRIYSTYLASQSLHGDSASSRRVAKENSFSAIISRRRWLLLGMAPYSMPCDILLQPCNFQISCYALSCRLTRLMKVYSILVSQPAFDSGIYHEIKRFLRSPSSGLGCVGSVYLWITDRLRFGVCQVH